MSSRLRAQAERQVRLTERSALKSLVALAVGLVEFGDLETFDAPPRVTTVDEYEDFEAVLDALSSEVDRS